LTGTAVVQDQPQFSNEAPAEPSVEFSTNIPSATQPESSPTPVEQYSSEAGSSPAPEFAEALPPVAASQPTVEPST
jgi:hypothetical protein